MNKTGNIPVVLLEGRDICKHANKSMNKIISNRSNSSKDKVSDGGGGGSWWTAFSWFQFHVSRFFFFSITAFTFCIYSNLGHYKMNNYGL